MAASASGESGGFWRGFLVGLVVAALGLLALAFIRPPAPATPPTIDPAAATGPDAPAAPDLGTAPEPPSGAALGPVAPGPLVEGDAPASPPSLVPIEPPAPSPASPSLVPVTPAPDAGDAPAVSRP